MPGAESAGRDAIIFIAAVADMHGGSKHARGLQAMHNYPIQAPSAYHERHRSGMGPPRVDATATYSHRRTSRTAQGMARVSRAVSAGEQDLEEPTGAL